MTNELADLESLICLAHYNLVSFSGSDKLSSFFSDQGKFRDIFVNHKNTVVYLSGHTHTQECTVIENSEDYTNKLVCITSPPFFKINSSMVNGFNIVDVILRRNAQNIYKPVGCEVQKFCADSINGNDVSPEQSFHVLLRDVTNGITINGNDISPEQLFHVENKFVAAAISINGKDVSPVQSRHVD